MSMQKFRWSRVYESSEEELTALLTQRGIEATHTTLVMTDEAVTHAATLWCAEGSLTISDQQTTLSLQPGDAVRITPNASYNIRAGISGCVYYES